MILSIEKNYLQDVLNSLKEKLRYIAKGGFEEYAVNMAIEHTKMAVADMQKYENFINKINHENSTCNMVGK